MGKKNTCNRKSITVSGLSFTCITQQVAFLSSKVLYIEKIVIVVWSFIVSSYSAEIRSGTKSCH